MASGLLPELGSKRRSTLTVSRLVETILATGESTIKRLMAGVPLGVLVDRLRQRH